MAGSVLEGGLSPGRSLFPPGTGGVRGRTGGLAPPSRRRRELARRKRRGPRKAEPRAALSRPIAAAQRTAGGQDQNQVGNGEIYAVAPCQADLRMRASKRAARAGQLDHLAGKRRDREKCLRWHSASRYQSISGDYEPPEAFIAVR